MTREQLPDAQVPQNEKPKDGPSTSAQGAQAGKRSKGKTESPLKPPVDDGNDAKDQLDGSAVAENVLKIVRACRRWLGRVLPAAVRWFDHAVRRCFVAVRDVFGFGQKDSTGSNGSADTGGSSQRKASIGAEDRKNGGEFDDSAISQGFIGSVLGSQTSESATQKVISGRSADTASRPVSKSVYRVRRIAALVVAVVVVIAIVFGCRALVSSLGRRDGSKAAQGSSQASSYSKQLQLKRSKSNQPSVSNKTKPPKADSLKAGQQKALTDRDRTDILAKAQATAAASGKPNRQYSYCVASRGDIGGNDVLQEFENTVFRTLNDQRGWPRAGATFAYSANSSRCDFTVYLSQASQMKTFSPTCSDSYSCCVGNNVVVNIDRFNGATPQLLAAGMGIDRYRVMVINHETGHRLGHLDNDPSCPAPGAPAPLMQEQSMNLRGCTPNEWPTDPELWVR